MNCFYYQQATTTDSRLMSCFSHQDIRLCELKLTQAKSDEQSCLSQLKSVTEMLETARQDREELLKWKEVLSNSAYEKTSIKRLVLLLCSVLFAYLSLNLTFDGIYAVPHSLRISTRLVLFRRKTWAV